MRNYIAHFIVQRHDLHLIYLETRLVILRYATFGYMCLCMRKKLRRYLVHVWRDKGPDILNLRNQLRFI